MSHLADRRDEHALVVGSARTELFNLGYETLLWLLTRFFIPWGRPANNSRTLTENASALMDGLLAPLGRTLTRLPAGPEHPDRTAGPPFEMYYQMGDFIPCAAPHGR